MSELYIADLRLDRLTPKVEAEVMRLFEEPWHIVYFSGAFVSDKFNMQQLTTLLKKRTTFLNAVNIAAQSGALHLLWDSTSFLDRHSLQILFPYGNIVVNYVVENMVQHANRFDNKPQQQIIWFVKPVFFLHWILEHIDLAIKKISGKSGLNCSGHMVERAVSRYKVYQMLAMEKPLSGSFRMADCTYYRW